MHRFGSYLAEEEHFGFQFSQPTLLWVIAANAIPVGEKEFAKKLLFQALTHAHGQKDLCYIHSNLAQIYQDEGNREKSNFHCRQALSTQCYNKWAVDTLINNLIQMNRLKDAGQVCETVLATDVYGQDRPKYRQILASVKSCSEMPVQEYLLPQF